MTPRLHNTEFLDRATNEALRRLDPAGIVDPQLADNPRAQDTLTRILATDPAGPTTPPPAVTGWLRGPARRWLLAGIALVGVGALVIVPGLRHGDPTSTTVPHTYPTLAGNTEFASWTPTSQAVTPAEAAKAGKDCTTKLVRLGVIGPAHPSPGLTVDQPGEAVVVDRRGPWTFVLTEGGQNGDFQAICLYDDNGSGKEVSGQLGSFAPGAVPSNTVVVGIPGVGGIDQDTYSWRTGRVGSDVASVVVNTVEKGPVKATVHDGYFAAWWPVPMSVVVATPDPRSPKPTYTLTLKDGTIKAAIPQAQLEPYPLQLRLVTSSAQGPCTLPQLRANNGPGSACDRAGTTTYELGESLGVLTPTSVARLDQGSGQTVVVGFDKADSNKLADVSRAVLEKRLAILLEGRVLTAPVVKEPMTTGNVSFAFGTASEAGQVAAALGASATP